MTKAFQRKFLAALAVLALLSTYVAIGFAICAGFPQITRNLANEHSNFNNSPYTHDALMELALETRDYTVEDYDRGSAGLEGAHEALAAEVVDAAHTSSDAGSPTADRWSVEACQALDEADVSPLVTMEELSQAGPQYALSSEALSHLDDVNEVISSLRMPLLGITLIAAFCLMGLVYMFGAKPAGWSLLIAGCATLGLFALVGLWAAFGFDGFFAVLHGLFFSEGTWTFPADSLLIQMYPQGFWMGMGLWWLSASCITAVASIVIGYLIVRKRKPNAAETFVPAGQQA